VILVHKQVLHVSKAHIRAGPHLQLILMRRHVEGPRVLEEHPPVVAQLPDEEHTPTNPRQLRIQYLAIFLMNCHHCHVDLS
jgi:hypothetical protein